MIELVIVIVILGIISVTAASKFLNLQSDARISALQGLRGGMQSAADGLPDCNSARFRKVKRC